MLIKIARAQEEEIGDGTTTATVLASALISEGAGHTARGVPVTKVIEGMGLGVQKAVDVVSSSSKKIRGLNDKLLWRCALISGREHRDVADLVVRAAKLIGMEKFKDPAFKLADTIIAKESAQNEVFTGLIIDKERMNRQMPRSVESPKILVVDDALEPEQLEDDALSTEAGFARFRELQQEFREGVHKIVDLGVKVVVTTKGIDDFAEEVFVDEGVLAIRRVSAKDIARLVEHIGARSIKRSGLKKDAAELEKFLGTCERVYQDERLEHIRVVGGKGKATAAVLVGASTPEVRDERERIAKDAAAAVQAAISGGVVPGGGAVEISAMRAVQELRESVRGMAAYGVDAVAEALKKPLTQIVANAGFNPLEKVEDVVAAQTKDRKGSLAIDCDSGEIADMLEMGVVDPSPVKLYALKAAAEVAEAILRINVIIRKKDESGTPSPQQVPQQPGTTPQGMI
jgi:chaperonin GroEL (HSP60 family)